MSKDSAAAACLGNKSALIRRPCKVRPHGRKLFRHNAVIHFQHRQQHMQTLLTVMIQLLGEHFRLWTNRRLKHSKQKMEVIGLSMAMPRSTYGSSHRSPTSRVDKDCSLFHLTIYSFLLSDCPLLDVVPSLSPALAYGTTYGLPMVTSALSLLIFGKRLKLHLFRLSYPGLVL